MLPSRGCFGGRDNGRGSTWTRVDAFVSILHKHSIAGRTNSIAEKETRTTQDRGRSEGGFRPWASFSKRLAHGRNPPSLLPRTCCLTGPWQERGRIPSVGHCQQVCGRIDLPGKPTLRTRTAPFDKNILPNRFPNRYATKTPLSHSRLVFHSPDHQHRLHMITPPPHNNPSG